MQDRLFQSLEVENIKSSKRSLTEQEYVLSKHYCEDLNIKNGKIISSYLDD
jgi:hypothetical protein